ncbi:MAG: hypothetical protein HQL49_07115 [Gammaproteobacteria bacterium]|nr:hypothetical protein [Gammaproteobacteria bacterium]
MPNIIAGLLAIAFGIWGLSVWWYSVMEALRGVVPLLLIAFGVIALMAGVTRFERREPSDADLMATLDEETSSSTKSADKSKD